MGLGLSSHGDHIPPEPEILKEILVDCTEEEKAKIVAGNAASIYRLK